IVCDVALADFFLDVAPVCLIIASIVLLIAAHRLTVASVADREGQAQFSQRISRECFRSALLPFSDQFRSVRLNGFAFTWRRHVTLCCFHGNMIAPDRRVCERPCFLPQHNSQACSTSQWNEGICATSGAGQYIARPLTRLRNKANSPRHL